MKIKLVDLQKQYQPLKGDILAEIERILDSMNLFLGENVRSFEEEFASYCGTRYAIGVENGTDALHLALWALEIGAGDEVITVSHTFIATAEAIAMTGATPVFVDINSDDYTMTVSEVEALITPRTKAILPVHLYGQAVDMDPLLEVARRYGLAVIEDGSQAQGCEYKGRRVGSLATVGCFSLYFSKNLGAYGEAGIITTNDDALKERIRLLRDHGSVRKYHHEVMGTNSRMDEIQAAILRVKLRHLDRWNDSRRTNAELYRRVLDGAGVALPHEREGGKHVYYVYVIRSECRDELREYLGKQGIETGIHYPIPIHRQPAAKAYGFVAGDLTTTDAVVDHILSLPMYPELTNHQIEYIGDHVHRYASHSMSAGPATAAR